MHVLVLKRKFKQMKKYIVLISAIFIASCSSKPSLQKYFVDNSESSDFVVLDLGSSIINTEKISLTSDEKKALESFEKLNVLVFKKDSLNDDKFETENAKVKSILKDKEYQELIKFGGKGKDAAVYFVGKEDDIDEFVLFASGKENGFAVVRVLGDDMSPTNILNIIEVMRKSKLDLEALKPLQDVLK